MKLFKNLRNQSGQSMMEYIIIVALIAVAAISGFTHFERTVRNQTAAMTEELADQDGRVEVALTATAASGAQTDAVKNKSLKDYVEHAFEVWK
jgi:Flp pilus assembly pilin Flp